MNVFSFQIAVCASLIAFLNVTPSSYKNTSSTPVSFKKLKLYTQNTVAPPRSLYGNRDKNDGLFNETSGSVELSGNAGDLPTAEIKSHLAVSVFIRSTFLRQNVYLFSKCRRFVSLTRRFSF